MKIPEVTKEEPYIEFKFDKTGKLFLDKTDSWWGGINRSFLGSGGFEGNTCEPQDLEKYMLAFQERKIKEINKEIKLLEKKKKQYLKLKILR